MPHIHLPLPSIYPVFLHHWPISTTDHPLIYFNPLIAIRQVVVTVMANPETSVGHAGMTCKCGNPSALHPPNASPLGGTQSAKAEVETHSVNKLLSPLYSNFNFILNRVFVCLIWHIFRWLVMNLLGLTRASPPSRSWCFGILKWRCAVYDLTSCQQQQHCGFARRARISSRDKLQTPPGVRCCGWPYSC